MGKFKKGDRVRYIGSNEMAKGWVGTVLSEASGWLEEDYNVEWDNGDTVITKPYARNLEPEVKTFEGIKKGDRVRFEAKKTDYSYSAKGLPTEYNGIEGTVLQDGSWSTARVKWDISEIGERASFIENLVVIDRPAPARKTVTVEFDAPVDENIENLVQQVTALTEVKYTIKEDN